MKYENLDTYIDGVPTLCCIPNDDRSVTIKKIVHDGIVSQVTPGHTAFSLIEVAKINGHLPGHFTVSATLPNAVVKKIKKFADTPIPDRGMRSKKYVAVVGKDFSPLAGDGDDTFSAYHKVPYPMAGDTKVAHEVDDDVNTRKLYIDTNYHFTWAEIDRMARLLASNGFPVPRAINVDDVPKELV